MAATAVLIAAAAVAVGGIATKANAALAKGDAALKEANFRAGVLRNNARIAKDAAKDTIESGKRAIQRKGIETSQLIGRQRTALAAQGVLVDEGSALDLVSDAAMVGREEEIIIQKNAELQAWKFLIDEMNAEANARISIFSGHRAKEAASAEATASILSGISSIGFSAAGAMG